MRIDLTKTLLFLTTLITGLLAGFFYTWSFTILHSLDLIAAVEASSAMTSINENIRNGWFAAIFFGAPLLILISLLRSFAIKNNKVSALIFIAFVFAIATLVITFTIHLPLNEQLAGGLNWSNYSESWVRWNHARMATSLAAFAFMLYSFLLRQLD